MQSLRTLSRWILAVSLGLATTGCANIGPLAWQARSTSGTSSASSALLSNPWALASEVSADYACATPLTNNITAQRSTTPRSTNTFMACPHKQNASEFALIAESRSITVCAFPIEVVNSNYIYPKMDLTNNAPLFQCKTLAVSTSNVLQAYGKFSFPMTTYNAAILVKFEDRARMTQCLLDAQIAATGMANCPEFSYGQFR